MTRWEELGMTAEEYVRSRWDFVSPDASSWVSIGPRTFDERVFLIIFKDIDAAAIFTAEREEQIRLKREEIALMREMISQWDHLIQFGYIGDTAVPRRIFAILESQLADLLKGWKA